MTRRRVAGFPIKHWTASVFVFAQQEGRWQIALLRHRKLGKWMIPGGHLERHENPEAAALREVEEELGVKVKLRTRDCNYWPDGRAQTAFVRRPLYIVEVRVPRFEDEAEHVHIDCLYFGVARRRALRYNPAESTAAAWFSIDQLEDLEMFELTRAIARVLFDKVDGASSQAEDF